MVWVWEFSDPARGRFTEEDIKVAKAAARKARKAAALNSPLHEDFCSRCGKVFGADGDTFCNRCGRHE
jgi:hypothetical protein